jgi:cell division protein FtsB
LTGESEYDSIPFMKYAAVRTSGRLGRLALPVACLCGAAYFVYHTLSGQYGLLALPLYQHHKTELIEQADMLAREIKHLDNRLALLDPKGIDPDLAEELVRRELGYVRDDEIIIPIPTD